LTSSGVEQPHESALAAAEVAPQVVRQPAVALIELAAAEAKQNEPVAEALRPSFSSTQGSLAAAAEASLRVEVSAAQPQAAEAAVQPRAVLVVELAAQPRAALLVARLKSNSTRTPRSCMDRNSVVTAPAVHAR